jgi:exopolyphosphatase/guanosine-5'-triphosphate,3'-diphosphate pyrophosphatase
VIDALGPTARASASLPLGAAALTEAWLRGDPYGSDELARARDHARRELAALAVPLRPVVVAIGGTATTFVAVERGMERYDGARVHGSRLSRAALEAAVARLAALRAAERRGVAGLAPERAPVIVAGGLVLAAVLAAAGAPETTVSDRGVRHGVLLDRLRRRG